MTALLIAHAVFASRPRTPLNRLRASPEAVTKRAAKDTGDKTGRAAYPGHGHGQKTREAKNGGAVETSKAWQAASFTTETAKRTSGGADRMASSATRPAAPITVKSVSDGDRHSQSQQCGLG